MTYLVVGWVFLITLFQGYIFWKFMNYEMNFQKIVTWGKTVDKSILRFARSLSKAQEQAYIDSVCSSCDCLLPENTARTHDGIMLCSDCKTKHFS